MESLEISTKQKSNSFFLNDSINDSIFGKLSESFKMQKVRKNLLSIILEK
jgi:hypothetical protein